jgi:cellulose synthase/poly-beta-1,6-N-acetylglucosamine synthase-like glycosyltransferase
MMGREVVGLTLIALPVAVGAYEFAVYPALVWLAARLRPPFRLPPEPAEWPRVTVLIVAYNEANRLPRTLVHALAVDYPADRMDVLVVSDASTDGTDALVAGHADPRVRLLRMPERRGKAAGENASGAHVTGDLVVSIDATILIPRDSLKALVRAMLRPDVGLASGRDISVGDEAREGTGAEAGYVGFEMWLRHQETRVHSIVGASGCFYATRRELHQAQLPDDLSRDFAAASVARRAGYRAVSVDAATCLVPRTTSLGNELRRKSRTMGRGLDTLWYLRGMMNPLRYGSFAAMLVSHKLMRWALFPAMAGWIAGPLFLYAEWPDALWLTELMLVGLLLGLWSARYSSGRRLPRLLALPAYLFVSLVAGWQAWTHLLRNERSAIWEPTPRPRVPVPAELEAGR